MRVLLHAVGGGDLGFAFGGAVGGVVDFGGDPDAVGVRRRPLRKVFDGLGEAGIEVDRVALIATVNRDRSGLAKPYAWYARGLAARLCDGPGLFGRRFAPGEVRVVEVAQPTMRDCMAAMGSALAESRPGECLVTFGTGSFALGAGALMAALEAELPTRLVPVDAVSAAYRLPETFESADRLRDWALRHRFWDELAVLDPAGAVLWRLLAARQRADVAAVSELIRTGGAPPGVPPGRLAKLAELWPAVQAAFFERVSRAEAIDQSLLRAWYGQQLANRLAAERDRLPEPARAAIAALVCGLTDGNGDGGTGSGGAALIRSVRRHLPAYATGKCAAMLRDERLEDLYRTAATHQAHLSEPAAERRPLPATIVEQAEVWENGDPVRKLVAARSGTAWPVLGSGDVLVLMSVGLPGPDAGEADAQAQEGLSRVIRWAARYRDALPRRGRVRLRLLASAESAEWARAWAAWAEIRLANVGGEVDVVRPLPADAGDLPDVRRRITEALEAAGAPTGLSGSGSLRDVDEIMLVVNPGKAVINHGMIAAGVDWSLRSACTLRVVELGRLRGVEPIVRDGGRVLRRLGPDPLLARLAAAAVRRLDLRTARRLLDCGSAALDGVRAAVDLLHRDLYAAPLPETDLAARCGLARQRLALVGHVLAGEPWSACYTAIEALRPGLFGWDGRAGEAAPPGPAAAPRNSTRWAHVKARSAALRELERLRNASPYAHLLDRVRKEREQRSGTARWRTEPPRGVRNLLDRAAADLWPGPGPRPPARPDPDRALLHRYERLCADLDRLAAAAPAHPRPPGRPAPPPPPAERPADTRI